MLTDISHFSERLTKKHKSAWSAHESTSLVISRHILTQSVVSNSGDPASLGGSFAHRIESKGPRTKPWGTPLSNGFSEEHLEFVLIFCPRSVRKSLTHFRGIRQFLDFRVSRAVFFCIISNVLLKSMQTAFIDFVLFRASFYSSLSAGRSFVRDNLFLKLFITV